MPDPDQVGVIADRLVRTIERILGRLSSFTDSELRWKQGISPALQPTFLWSIPSLFRTSRTTPWEERRVYLTLRRLDHDNDSTEQGIEGGGDDHGIGPDVSDTERNNTINVGGGHQSNAQIINNVHYHVRSNDAAPKISNWAFEDGERMFSILSLWLHALADDMLWTRTSDAPPDIPTVLSNFIYARVVGISGPNVSMRVHTVAMMQWWLGTAVKLGKSVDGYQIEQGPRDTAFDHFPVFGAFLSRPAQ